jgi:hypothetical protein
MNAVSPTSPAPRATRVIWLCWGLIGLAGAGVLLLLAAFDPARYALYPRCAFKAMTGWDCPGCGGLRAAHQLLHGHWREAFNLNPLLMIAGPVGLLLALGEWVRRKTGLAWAQPFQHRAWLWVVLGLVAVFGVVRNLSIRPWGGGSP